MPDEEVGEENGLKFNGIFEIYLDGDRIHEGIA